MNNIPTLIITSCLECKKANTDYNADFVICIGPDYDHTHATTGLKDRFVANFVDVEDPNESDLAPNENDIIKLIDFGKEILEKQYRCGLVHCFAGVSRSPAVVYLLYCLWLGPGKEYKAMKLTEQSAIFGGIDPNTLIIKLGDKVLGRNGAMVGAFKTWQRNRIQHKTHM